MRDSYTTPEGYTLHRPLLMPDARTFSDVLTYVREWDFDHMNHVRGEIPASGRHLVPSAQTIEARGPARDLMCGILDIGRDLGAPFPPDDPADRNTIGPFCSIDATAIGGMRRNIAAHVVPEVLEVLAPRLVTSDDRLGLRVTVHAPRDGKPARALVVASHGVISGSHYIAYVDPETIPAYPFELRDIAAGYVRDAMERAGLRVVRYRTPEPYAIEYRDGHNAPASSATRSIIAPDGSITGWARGEVI